MIKCPNCDESVEADVAFCPNCGTRIAAPSSAGRETTLMSDPTSTGKASVYDQPSTPAPYTPQAYTPPQPYTPQPYTPPQAYAGSSFSPSVLPNSTAAIISLVFGILSWVALPLIGCIVAVVAGHMAKREIRASNGQIAGNGMATAGLILGYLQLAFFLVGICLLALLIVGGAASGADFS